MRLSRRAVLAGGAALAAAGGAGLFYAKAGHGSKGKGLARFAVGGMSKLEVADPPLPAPGFGFQGPQGQAVGLADFRGQVAVVNLWAMWCAPCREEMPTLAVLAGRLAGRPAQVVTVNVDHDEARLAEARTFLAGHPPLPFYRDPRFQLPFELPGKGAMPQTVLIDAQGRIRAWLTGGADWSGAEALAVVEALITEI